MRRLLWPYCRIVGHKAAVAHYIAPFETYPVKLGFFHFGTVARCERCGCTFDGDGLPLLEPNFPT